MILIRILVLLACFITSPNWVKAADFTITLLDEHNYFYRLTQAALAAADGDHSLTFYGFPQEIPQTRILRSLVDNSSPFNLTFTGHNTGREELLQQVDIPLTRGLFGYRVFVVTDASAQKFSSVKTLDDLTKRISLGSGASWPDTTILRGAGFQVRTGNTITLWSMLARRRFDAFPRSIYEVGFELERHNYKAEGIPLKVEETVMLYYPFDLFFYLAPNDQERTDILTQGLVRLYENGRFMEIFLNDPTIKAALEMAEAHNRKIFRIPNPLNSMRVNNIASDYWHSFTEQD